MIYYVDIDETICRYEGDRNYPDALPIEENIEKEYKLLNVDLRNIVLDNYFKYKTYYLNDKKTGHKEFIQQILDGKRTLY